MVKNKFCPFFSVHTFHHVETVGAYFRLISYWKQDIYICTKDSIIGPYYRKNDLWGLQQPLRKIPYKKGTG